MAYDAGVYQCTRSRLAERYGFSEKRMFGGVAFLCSGNMAIGLLGDHLIVRVGPDAMQRCLREPHTRVFDITGRTMKGWVMVAVEGLGDDEVLFAWIERGWTFAGSLPRK